MLFSAACCLVSNLMYCYAFDARYLWALYAARLLTGLGEQMLAPKLACYPSSAADRRNSCLAHTGHATLLLFQTERTCTPLACGNMIRMLTNYRGHGDGCT